MPSGSHNAGIPPWRIRVKLGDTGALQGVRKASAAAMGATFKAGRLKAAGLVGGRAQGDLWLQTHPQAALEGGTRPSGSLRAGNRGVPAWATGAANPARNAAGLKADWKRLGADWIVVDRAAYGGNRLAEIDHTVRRIAGLQPMRSDERFLVYGTTGVAAGKE